MKLELKCFTFILDVSIVSENDDISVVERLFSSSLVALVSLSSPRKLKVCHFKKGTEICNYSYSNTILAVKLNRLVRVVRFNPIDPTEFGNNVSVLPRAAFIYLYISNSVKYAMGVFSFFAGNFCILHFLTLQAVFI